jgi:predicted Zn-dependent protease
MFKSGIKILLVSALTAACASVPITGRRQLSLVPESTINQMAAQQYSEFVSSNKLSSNDQATTMVKRVGRKIQSGVEQYFAERKQSERLRDYKWEFNLIEDSLVNAWCMPGGKVVVYTGLLPVSKDENGLAVVMGHEIAHAIAQHGEERMSQGLVTQFGGMALSAALSQKPQQTQQLFMTAYGLGATLGVLLPYSRLHESEADRIGLIFMAMAGYDPRGALVFWQRMAAQKDGGGAPPEFLSTHPSDQTRIENIQKIIPEAMQYYKKS